MQDNLISRQSMPLLQMSIPYHSTAFLRVYFPTLVHFKSSEISMSRQGFDQTCCKNLGVFIQHAQCMTNSGFEFCAWKACPLFYILASQSEGTGGYPEIDFSLQQAVLGKSRVCLFTDDCTLCSIIRTPINLIELQDKLINTGILAKEATNVL